MGHPNEDYKDEIKIIENTKQDRDEFGIANGGTEILLSQEQLNALINGKCIAVYDGEYTNFISLYVDRGIVSG